MREVEKYWLGRAMELARRAAAAGDVPVGALVVDSATGSVIGEGWNTREADNDPAGHAEIMALRAAGAQLGNYRLLETTLYVTLEPCLMCVGAMIHARIGRLVYGASDLKTGAVHSVFPLLGDPRHNHQIPVTAGVLAEECSLQLSRFFQKRRAQIKAQRNARNNQQNQIDIN